MKQHTRSTKAIRRTLLTTLPLLMIWIACASTQTVKVDGRSKVVVTATSRLKLKFKGPMTFPDHWPGVGGMHLGEGVELDVELEPGETVTLLDRVRVDGESVIIGIEELEQRNLSEGRNVAQHTAATVAVAGPLVELDAVVGSGSTYTWTIPSLLGDNPAVVPVTGTTTARTPLSSLTDNGDGTFSIDISRVIDFTYDVSGPPAVWQLPLDTPYGLLDGTGTVETATGMVLGFTGDLDSVSAAATSGYVDEDGQPFDFGYTGAFPIKLSVGGGTAVGVTTVWGGIDTY